jgi:hypothetical protein
MRKVSTTTKVVKVITKFCDKCNTEIEHRNRYSGFECSLELSVGEIDVYEGFIGEKYYVDLCDPCANDLFFKVLKEHGISVNKEI